MKRFTIPISWSVCGEIEIEANDIEEAIQTVYDTIDDIRLPEENSYVDSSLEIDEDLARYLAEEDE